MVWILNVVNKPIKVRLGSPAMNAAANVYMSEDEAKAAQRQLCRHETILGNRSTGRKFCADCGIPVLVNRFKPNQTVRINDTQSEYHKCLARVVKVGVKSYDVTVGATRLRVVPEQLLGVRKP